MSGAELQGEGDRFLIDGIRAGSADAFRRLVDRFGGRLKAFAARRLGGSGIDPEDAVQETFLALLGNIGRLEGVRSLQAYLFTILRCRIADLARARGHSGRALSLDALEPRSGLEPASPGATPSAYAREDEAVKASRAVLAEALDAYLARLKGERQFRELKVLELVFAQGRTHQEAARLAGTSEPTVSRIRRAAVEELRRQVARHPLAPALEDLPAGSGESLITELWRENLFTCLKRSTLGSHALGVLDAEWSDYVRFHLEAAGCEFCAAHLADITAGSEGISRAAREKILASSAGFLR
jgi:RNA polymerase sigma-70 factor (ECF subfamily)